MWHDASMELSFTWLWQQLSLVDVAGLAMVVGLALYGVTGIGDDDGWDGTSDGE